MNTLRIDRHGNELVGRLSSLNIDFNVHVPLPVDALFGRSYPKIGSRLAGSNSALRVRRCAAHDRAADRTAHLAAQRFAEVGGDLAAPDWSLCASPRAMVWVGQPRAARPIGAEQAAEKPPIPPIAAAGRLRLRCARRTGAFAHLGLLLGDALLQHLIG